MAVGTAVAAGLVSLVAMSGAVHGAAEAPAAVNTATVPRYEYIFLIILENRSYSNILGKQSIAPNINRLAEQYGQATQFYAEVHPSEGNYVAMLGGDTFGIHDDDAYYCKPGVHDRFCPKADQPGYADHTVTAPSLVDQLESHGLTWKGYMESIPAPGSDAARWPTKDKPVAGMPPELYAVKHNGFMSFRHVQDDPHRAEKIVGFDELERDIATGHLPNYAHIVPNQCNDMHGRDKSGPDVPEDCTKASGGGLISRGDRVAGKLVDEIMHTTVWSGPNNAAIVITFDENDKDERSGADQGCCGSDPKSVANFGGGLIPTIVITNHGVRGVRDPTPYNHYSLLRTTETAFGIEEHLGNAANVKAGVKDMIPLFKVP